MWANCESHHSALQPRGLEKVTWKERPESEVVSEHSTQQTSSLAGCSPALYQPSSSCSSLGMHLSERPENNCQLFLLPDCFNLFFCSGLLPGQLLLKLHLIKLVCKLLLQVLLLSSPIADDQAWWSWLLPPTGWIWGSSGVNNSTDKCRILFPWQCVDAM